MKIETHLLPPGITIEEFADEHELIMEVRGHTASAKKEAGLRCRLCMPHTKRPAVRLPLPPLHPRADAGGREMIRTLELFAGIGGIGLGLERTGGFEVVGQCEIDPFCRQVLAKHWPHVWRHDDIGSLTAKLISDNCGAVDCVTGGFPCQDISAAGKGAGIVAGERSSLWWQMFRIIATVRPTWVIAENVPALRTRGADDVIAVLEAIGYSCWPLVVGAWAVGAPHRRDRIWIVANSAGCGNGEQRSVPVRQGRSLEAEADALRTGYELEYSESLRRTAEGYDDGRLADGEGAGMADPDGAGREERHASTVANGPGHRSWYAAEARWPARHGEQQFDWEEPRLAYAASESRGSAGQSRDSADSGSSQREMGSAADGLSARLVRFANRSALKAYGNSVVPQIPQAIGNAILRLEAIL